MKKKVSYREKWKITGMFFAFPSFIILVVFIVLPIALNIRYCFTDYDGIRSNYNFVGLDNFVKVIQAEGFGRIVLNTFVLAVLYVAGLNVLAILIAVFVTHYMLHADCTWFYGRVCNSCIGK